MCACTCGICGPDVLPGQLRSSHLIMMTILEFLLLFNIMFMNEDFNSMTLKKYDLSAVCALRYVDRT